MSEREPTLSSDDLATHTAWVRRLARRLLEDDDRADDLAQDAWIVLQRQPAGTIANARSWIAGVVARSARRHHARESSRRDAARRAAVRGDLGARIAPSTGEVLEAEATRRLVVEAVLALDEPYRSTLLLHFYDDLAPAEIARRLGVPGSTARSRLQRGLALVRAKLGERDPRNDGGVRASLLLIAGSGRPGWTTAKGILVAGTTSKLVAAGALLATLALWAWWSADDAPGDGDVRRETASVVEPESVAESATVSLAADAEREPARVGSAAAASASDGRWHLAMQREPGVVRGTVVLGTGKEPVAGAEVRLVTSVGDVAHGALLFDERAPLDLRRVTGVGGGFEFADIPSGSYRIRARAADGSDVRQSVTASRAPAPVLLELEPNGRRWDRIEALDVRTTDERGSALPNARVVFAWLDLDGAEHERAIVSDALGVAAFADLEMRSGTLTATTEDRVAHVAVTRSSTAYREWLRGSVADRAAPFRVDLVVGAAGSVAGTVENGAGAIVHVTMRETTLFDPVRHPRVSATCAPDGTFTIAGVPAGAYVLGVDAPAGSRARLPPPYVDDWPGTKAPSPRFVVVAAGATTPVRIELAPAAGIRGRVLDDGTGAPLAGAVVRAWVGREWSQRTGRPLRGGVRVGDVARPDFEYASPATRIETRTDAAGRYRVSGLGAADGWTVEVQRPGYARDRVQPSDLRDGATLELEHRLATAGGIQGVAWRAAWIGIVRAGRACCEDVLLLTHDRDATFTVTGLPAGRHTLFVVDWLDAGLRTELTTVDVRAGEMTWIDLRTVLPYVGRGRLLHRGKPVAGATVDYTSGGNAQYSRGSTDAEGRFEVGTPYVEGTGSATITAFAPEIPGALVTTFEVGDFLATNGTSRDLELGPGELVLRVVDAAGAPLRGTVQLERMSGPTRDGVHSSIAGLSRSLDAAGRIRLAALPTGIAHLRVRTDAGWNFVAADVAVTDSEQLVEVRAPPTGRVRVLVLDAAGIPMAGVKSNVAVRVDGNEFELAVMRLSDARGEVEFPLVPAGRCQVNAWIPSEAGRDGRSTSAEIDVVDSAESSVTLTLP